MQANTSHSLLDRLKSNSTARDWDIFVSIYRPLILGQLGRFNVTGADAEDICQETLTQVFKAIGKFDHNGRDGAFRNWLRIIVRQRLSRFVAKSNNKVNGALAESDEIAIESSLHDYWDREHDRHVINKLLELIRKEFTESSWNSFRRVVIELEEPKLVAQSMSLTLNSVLISKSRIMRRLREIGQGLIDQL